jgi:hypothetical protein
LRKRGVPAALAEGGERMRIRGVLWHAFVILKLNKLKKKEPG